MRDHRNIKAFKLADQLCLFTYVATGDFPKSETFGLQSQMRRSASSVVFNIVEGCGRNSTADFIHFLDMSFGSLRELEYQISLAKRLGYIQDPQITNYENMAEETARVLHGFIKTVRSGLSNRKL